VEHQHVTPADAERMKLRNQRAAVIARHEGDSSMAALLVLYILVGVALVAVGVVILASQKALEGRKRPVQRNTSGSPRS
jgi:hypothetical protein